MSYYKNLSENSNLTDTITTSQAITIKKYYFQPSLKLLSPAEKQVLSIAKKFFAGLNKYI